ncbi:MAG: 6-carboxytetrahydropterin synthase QueD [Syntrophales bacterium]|nr:6-carboxytetrahydropterin synthase QueD [Syntrophales bacterium]
MYEISIRECFSAAHSLEMGGRCENLHGHNYHVEITVSGPALDEKGILVDFRDLKRWVSEILETLDHSYLNETSAFRGINPSAENIAAYIYKELLSRIKIPGVKLKEVTVWESDNARATYKEP